MLDFAPLAVVYIFLSALFLDAKTAGVMYAIKAYRVLTLWFITSVMEKVFLENYLRRTFVEHGRPPDFSQLVTVSWAVEFFALAVPMFILSLLYLRYKAHDNAFVVDSHLLSSVVFDYLLSSALFVSIGLIIARRVQDENLFRYKHDGMRGIRAGTLMFFRASIVVILVPFYGIVE